jgi:hypothetical protein
MTIMRVTRAPSSLFPPFLRINQDLPEAMRAAKQAQLDHLEQKSSHSIIVRKERTVASKYHKIKFFERVKIERRIKQVERRLVEARAGASAAAGSDGDSDSESEKDEGNQESDDEGVGAVQSVPQLEKMLAKWKNDLDYLTVCLCAPWPNTYCCICMISISFMR